MGFSVTDDRRATPSHALQTSTCDGNVSSHVWDVRETEPPLLAQCSFFCALLPLI